MGAGVAHRGGGGWSDYRSGIESGRISRPYFGTVKKRAQTLGVKTGEVLPREGTGRVEDRSRSVRRCPRERRNSRRASKGPHSGILGASWELGEEHER